MEGQQLRRYLALRNLTIESDPPFLPSVLKPGDEISMTDDVAAEVLAENPGAIVLMDPRSEAQAD